MPYDLQEPYLVGVAILKTFAALGNPSSPPFNAWTGDDPCGGEAGSAWAGIKCDTGSPYNSVTEIDIQDAQLSGDLPPSLFNLTSLRLLNLALNPNLTGSFPDALRNLLQLTTLDMHGCGLSGSIPATIGRLTSLSYFLVKQNRLSGSLPTQIGTLPRLYMLDVMENQLEGPLPKFQGANELSHLHMSNNLFTSVPAEISRLPKLLHLLMDSNRLTHDFPLAFNNTNLTVIYWSNNIIPGPFPSTWFFPRLKDFLFSNCSLPKQPLPSFPISRNLSNLLSATDRLSPPPPFSPPLPLSPFPSLPPPPSALPPLHLPTSPPRDLSSNSFTGSIPGSLFWQHPNLSHGNRPPSLGLSMTPPLSLLPPSIASNLANNDLSSSFPPAIADAASLQSVPLTPVLTGIRYPNSCAMSTFPPSLHPFPNHPSSFLSGNQLSGPLPDLSSLPSIVSLSLFDNSLSSLPPALLAKTNNITLQLFNNDLCKPFKPDYTQVCSPPTPLTQYTSPAFCDGLACENDLYSPSAPLYNESHSCVCVSPLRVDLKLFISDFVVYHEALVQQLEQRIFSELTSKSQINISRPQQVSDQHQSTLIITLFFPTTPPPSPPGPRLCNQQPLHARLHLRLGAHQPPVLVSAIRSPASLDSLASTFASDHINHESTLIITVLFFPPDGDGSWHPRDTPQAIRNALTTRDLAMRVALSNFGLFRVVGFYGPAPYTPPAQQQTASSGLSTGAIVAISVSSAAVAIALIVLLLMRPWERRGDLWSSEDYRAIEGLQMLGVRRCELKERQYVLPTPPHLSPPLPFPSHPSSPLPTSLFSYNRRPVELGGLQGNRGVADAGGAPVQAQGHSGCDPGVQDAAGGGRIRTVSEVLNHCQVYSGDTEMLCFHLGSRFCSPCVAYLLPMRCLSAPHALPICSPCVAYLLPMRCLSAPHALPICSPCVAYLLPMPCLFAPHTPVLESGGVVPYVYRGVMEWGEVVAVKRAKGHVKVGQDQLCQSGEPSVVRHEISQRLLSAPVAPPQPHGAKTPLSPSVYRTLPHMPHLPTHQLCGMEFHNEIQLLSAVCDRNLKALRAFYPAAVRRAPSQPGGTQGLLCLSNSPPSPTPPCARPNHYQLCGTEFRNEIQLLSAVRHRNLVALKGFCVEAGEQLLVYEFIERGTLEDMLRGEKKMLRGEKKMLRGEKKMLRGEKKMLRGEKKMLRGEKKMLRGEKKMLRGEKKMLRGEKKMLRGEKKMLRGEKKMLRGEKKMLRGEKKMLRGEKRRGECIKSRVFPVEADDAAETANILIAAGLEAKVAEFGISKATANILITAGLEAKVADFGISKAVPEEVEKGGRLDTQVKGTVVSAEMRKAISGGGSGVGAGRNREWNV
ncbi:unnamed protein product [Closterium sp. NIES-65]|nr:unnamed protein product [Closterium sp. NIES-65]